jgi:thymidylate synthase (FAD)
MTDANQKIPLLGGGYIRFVEDWGRGDTQIAEAGIIEAARMSTQKSFLGWGAKCGACGEPLPDNAVGYATCGPCNKNVDIIRGDENLLRYLHEHKHETPFEFAGMIVEVQAPIMVFREWHRHRVQAFNEMSARYSPLPSNDYMPTPERCLMVPGKNKQAAGIAEADVLTHESAIEWLGELEQAYAMSERVYQSGLKRGIPKELARLPVGVGRFSRMRASAVLRNWLAFMTLRSEKNPNAQWEIRQFGNALAEICRARFPRTMALFDA